MFDYYKLQKSFEDALKNHETHKSWINILAGITTLVIKFVAGGLLVSFLLSTLWGKELSFLNSGLVAVFLPGFIFRILFVIFLLFQFGVL